MLGTRSRFNSFEAVETGYLGRVHLVSPALLHPYPEALSAFALWLSLPRTRREARLVVQRSESSWRWCGGFEGLPAATERGRIEVLALPKSLSDERIRQMLWAEAISPLGLQRQAVPQWQGLIKRHLPAALPSWVIVGAKGGEA